MVQTRRFRVLAARTALAALLFAGAAACGDDDNTVDETGDKGASYCAALVDFNAAALQSELDEDSSPEDIQAAADTLTPLWNAVETNVPDSAADAATELGATIDALGEGDAGPFNEDATFETYTTLINDTVGDCGFETLGAEAIDYAFQGLPTSVKAGTLALSLENKTAKNETHEMIIFKKADGETRSAMELLSDPALEEQGPGEFAGATVAEPGQTGAGLMQVTAGDYVVVCFVPVGSGDVPEGEEGDGPPHFTEGMVAEFKVS